MPTISSYANTIYEFKWSGIGEDFGGVHLSDYLPTVMHSTIISGAATILAVCLGIFISVFARNEFQMVQFIPLIILPQIFLCGLLWPVEQMPEYLQWIARFLPLTYGVDGIRALMLEGQGLLDIGKEIGVLAGYAAGLMVLASLTLRRGAS